MREGVARGDDGGGCGRKEGRTEGWDGRMREGDEGGELGRQIQKGMD